MKDLITERFEKVVADAGFKNEKTWHSAQQGPGDFPSYFEYLVERKLEGKENLEPIPEEMWKAMKMQLNFYSRQLAKAAEDYTKLQNKLRDAELMIRDLQRESR